MGNVLQIVDSVTCSDGGGGGVYLPDEIVTVILVRLPPKFLGRCKCVSKEWDTLISDPEFIKTNFSVNTRRQKKAIYLGKAVLERGPRYHRPLAIVDADSGVSFPKLKIRENHPWSWLKIFGSCNGLVLALDTEHKLFLLNPTTRAYKIVPTLPDIDPTLEWVPEKSPIVGLGYDSVTNNYKVITITPTQTVFVYTFKSGRWKRVQGCPFAYVHCVGSNIFLNASIHWLPAYYSSVSVITAFDLTTEKFREVPLPRALRIMYTSYLEVVGGCLCVLINNAHRRRPAAGFDIWVMKEYGNEESWTKFSVNYKLPVVQPQDGFVGDHLEELRLIDHKRDKVWFYDANKGKWRGVSLGVYGWPSYWCKFVDSLISP